MKDAFYLIIGLVLLCCPITLPLGIFFILKSIGEIAKDERS